VCIARVRIYNTILVLAYDGEKTRLRDPSPGYRARRHIMISLITRQADQWQPLISGEILRAGHGRRTFLRRSVDSNAISDRDRSRITRTSYPWNKSDGSERTPTGDTGTVWTSAVVKNEIKTIDCAVNAISINTDGRWRSRLPYYRARSILLYGAPVGSECAQKHAEDAGWGEDGKGEKIAIFNSCSPVRCTYMLTSSWVYLYGINRT
jgi:hypothetical protein